MAAMLSFLVPVIFFGFNGNLFEEKNCQNFKFTVYLHKKRQKKFDLTLLNMFANIKFASGSESEWFDRIRIWIRTL